MNTTAAPPSTADQQLMAKIRTDMQAAISAAIEGTPFSEPFIAALVANESGDNPAATRLEPKVLADLCRVYLAIKPALGSIGAVDIDEDLSTIRSLDFGLRLGRLMSLATSWGPTQIMGYESIAGKYPLSDLTKNQTHFARCVMLLDAFKKEWHLEPTALAPFQFEEKLFRCWNTGRPDGVTADPHYVSRGLGRMVLYEALPKEETK